MAVASVLGQKHCGDPDPIILAGGYDAQNPPVAFAKGAESAEPAEVDRVRFERVGMTVDLLELQPKPLPVGDLTAGVAVNVGLADGRQGNVKVPVFVVAPDRSAIRCDVLAHSILGKHIEIGVFDCEAYPHEGRPCRSRLQGQL